MKVLIVGGTGLIGGHAALHLQQQGCEVCLMARNPSQVSSLAGLPFVAADYSEDYCGDGRLRGCDALVFAAAADVRHLPPDGSVTDATQTALLGYSRNRVEGMMREVVQAFAG